MIGFSGSRKVLEQDAIEKIEEILFVLRLNFKNEATIVTGGCIGVDALVARLAAGLLFKVFTIIPANTRAVDKYWAVYAKESFIFKEGSYKNRNEKIVEVSDILVALVSVPEFDKNGEFTHSGTWQTVRLARKKKIPVLVIEVKEK